MSNDTQLSTAHSTEESEGVGLAGNLTRTFLHSPLTPLLLVLFLLLGLFGLYATPRQEDPQISVPMADIFVSYPGATAQQVNSQVAVPLEQLMMEIKGVDHVYSASMRDQALVTVQFDVGEDTEASKVKMYDKLASNVDLIPPGASEPLVKPKSVDDVPVVTLTLWSEEVDDASLRLVALDLMKHIKRIPDTSQGFIVSGRQEQMSVHIYPEKLAGFGITLDQIAQKIKATNTERKAGESEVGGLVSTIYTGAFLQTEQDLQRLIVGLNGSRPVYLRDVADVHRGPGEATSLVSYYTGAGSELGIEAIGVPAVTVAIAKKKSSNGVTVAEQVIELVDALKGRIIPDNVHVSITRNYGETAKEKVNELIFKLFVATGAVVFLVWFFLGWRAALVVAIVVPVVITFTVFMALMLGFTIDRVSLFALIFSIGILVDDAIVVVENVYRRWLEKGGIDDETTIDAVAEVGNPTILATFTVVAALLPMAAVRGMMGPYMAPIPVLGSVAMLFSLFAAFVFTPWLAYKLRPDMASLHKAEQKELREIELLGRFYRAVLLPMIHNRKLGRLFLYGLFVVFFLCMLLFYVKAVQVKMLPLDNKPEFNVVVNFPEGTALAETANLVSELAEKIRTIDEVTAIQTYVGNASPFNFNGLVRHYYLRDKPWQADLQIQLTEKNHRDRSSHEIAEAVRTMVAPIVKQAGGRAQIVEMPPGPPVLQSVVAEVYGPDDETRRAVARDLEGFFEKAKHLDDVDVLMPDDYDIWTFNVDREKAQRIGVNVDDINRTLEMAMGSFVLGDIKYESVLDVTRIVMEIPLALRGDFGRLGQMPVPTRTGKVVPLSEIGSFVKTRQDPVIYHKDLRPVEFVTAETVGDLAAPIYGMFEVEEMLKDYKTPDGVTISGTMTGPPEDGYRSGFEWAGEWTVTYETFRDMGIAFGVALVMIYMLVVWEFGNFILPAIVMAPIPLTLVGIVPGHWLLGAEFTATSMIGFIALAGIIVRNSILLVDFSKHKVNEGLPVLDALILACQVRTRPILITALALVGGSSVILFDPIFQGMAVALLFGVLVSTILTLFIIPLGCYSARAIFLSEADGGDGTEKEEGPSVFWHHSKALLGLLGVSLWVVTSTLAVWLYHGIRWLLSWGMAQYRKRSEWAGKVETLSSRWRQTADPGNHETNDQKQQDEAAVIPSKAPLATAGIDGATESFDDGSASVAKPAAKKPVRKKASTKKSSVKKSATAKKSAAKKKTVAVKKAKPPVKKASKVTANPGGEIAAPEKIQAAATPVKPAVRKGRRGIRLKGQKGPADK